MSEQTALAAKRLLERYKVYEEAWERKINPPAFMAPEERVTSQWGGYSYSLTEKEEFIRTMAVIDATMPEEEGR